MANTYTLNHTGPEIDSLLDSISNKEDAFTVGAGLSMTNRILSLDASQAYISCGHIAPFATTTAPDGYLACDGSEYLKTDYPELAELLASVDTEQSTEYFIGTDSSHFKAPDLQGEFIRGTGTNGHTNQGNGGAIGEHQDGTEHFDVYSADTGGKGILWPPNESTTKVDSVIGHTPNTYAGVAGTVRTGATIDTTITSRPTNTSFLYCIAYQNIYLTPRHQYSTDEHIVGTWIDGKPIYEKTISGSFTLTSATGYTLANVIFTSEISNVEKIISHVIFVENLQLPYVHGMAALNMGCNVTSSQLEFRCGTSQTGTKTYRATLQYTKTTQL